MGWDCPNEWFTILMDVLAENTKKGDSWWSWTLEELHFDFWCLCYFLVLLLFVGYIFGVLFFMECWHLDQKLVAQRCFLDFVWLCEEDDAKSINGGKMCLVGKGNKSLMTTKVKHFGLWT